MPDEIKFEDVNTRLSNKVLITTDYGKYVWNPILQLIDFIIIGHRRAHHTIHLRDKDNTELRAMIKATQDMLTLLKEDRKRRESTKEV